MINIPGLDKIYNYDEELATKGAKMFLGINEKGQEMGLIIGRAGNPKHEAMQRKKSDDLERARYSPEKRKEIIREIVADGLFFGWYGMLDKDHNEIESTKENKMEVLTRYDDLVTDIMNFANDNKNYQTEEEKELGLDAEEESEKN